MHTPCPSQQNTAVTLTPESKQTLAQITKQLTSMQDDLQQVQGDVSHVNAKVDKVVIQLKGAGMRYATELHSLYCSGAYHWDMGGQDSAAACQVPLGSCLALLETV